MDEKERITSRENRRLVAVRKIRDGKDRSHIFIEGVRLVEEAVRSGIVIRECFASDSFSSWEGFPDLEKDAVAVADHLFPTISDTKSPQGIIVIAQRPEHGLESLARTLNGVSEAPLVYLSFVNNPANLGAVMRTAEAAGAAGVITSPGSADAYSPKALRAAMGSAFRLLVVQEVDLKAARMWAHKLGLRVAAVDVGGDRNYTEADWTQPMILVFGSEAHGLSEDDLAEIETTMSIPMASKVESLNLAVSVGVILFEARRQRQ